jgi:hypothetical protein
MSGAAPLWAEAREVLLAVTLAVAPSSVMAAFPPDLARVDFAAVAARDVALALAALPFADVVLDLLVGVEAPAVLAMEDSFGTQERDRRRRLLAMTERNAPFSP